VLLFFAMPLYSTQIRLRPEDYVGRRVYFVTLCCAGRRRAFGDEEKGQQILKELIAWSARWKFTLHAYCVMPDHLHLVAEGAEPGCDLLKFIHSFKQRTGFPYKQVCGQQLWQGRFYERILRREDRVEDVACYVWWNPVRAGLCSKPKEYPLSGSQTIDWMKWEGGRTEWSPSWKETGVGEGGKMGNAEGVPGFHPKAADVNKAKDPEPR
jgi:REP-associated tyrosine transposase